MLTVELVTTAGEDSPRSSACAVGSPCVAEEYRASPTVGGPARPSSSLSTEGQYFCTVVPDLRCFDFAICRFCIVVEVMCVQEKPHFKVGIVCLSGLMLCGLSLASGTLAALRLPVAPGLEEAAAVVLSHAVL